MHAGNTLPGPIRRQQAVSSLEQRLRPASSDEIADRLQVVLAQFPAQASGDSDLRMQGYLFALAGVGVDALETAIRAILRGETDCDPRFMPTAPQMARVCRLFQSYDERALRRARNNQAQLDGPGYYLESWMQEPQKAEALGNVVVNLPVVNRASTRGRA